MLLNIDLQIINEQRGGSTDEMIKNMNTNTHMIANDSRTIEFSFNDNLNTNTIGNSKYLGAGGYTGVFNINYNPQHQSPIPLLLGKNLILRVLLYHTNMKLYIGQYNKYTNPKLELDRNIPEHYMYGNLTFADGTIKQYIIVKKYNNSDAIKTLSLKDKVILMNSCLKFIGKLNKFKISYKDLKFNNIGFDEHNNYIVLDYDESTLFENSDIENGRFPLLNFTTIGSTFPPLYVVHMNADIKSRLRDRNTRHYDKIYTLGLADLFIHFFYDHPVILDIMNQFTYPVDDDWEKWDKRYGLFRNIINRISRKINSQSVTIHISEPNKLLLKELIKSLIKPKNFNFATSETADNEYMNTATIDEIQEQFNQIFIDILGKTKYLKMKEKYIRLKNKIYSI